MRTIIPAVRVLRFGLIGFLYWCLLFITATSAVASQHENELLIGIEPEHNIFDNMERYRYLADYISNQLGVKVRLTIMSRYGEVIKRFKTLKLDGAFLTPYTATMGIKELQLEPLVNPVNPDGDSTSQGYIFVRKDSGISSIADMERDNIVFVDPATMEGYLFPLAFLQQHGVNDISKFFHRYYFSGSHASAVYAVLDGRADIGAAKNTVYNRLVHNDPSIGQDLLIIAKSPKVPEMTLCMKSDLSQEILEKLTDILLRMDKSPPGMEVLEQFKASRFVKAKKHDFAVIEEMALKSLGSLTVHGR